MPTEHILSLLVAERDKLSRAIAALQGPAKRRGRPPKNPSAVAAPVVTEAPIRQRKRKRRTAVQRKAQAERMKAYWAKRKKKAKEG